MTTTTEPAAVMVRRYECPFCRRRRSSRQAVAEHIARCWLNPAVRSCKTCDHLEVGRGGDDCVPGRPCNCNEGYVQCHAGLALTFDDLPVTGCPLWEAPAEEARS